MNDWKQYLPNDDKSRGLILQALKHLEEFMHQASLFPSSNKAIIALSGGVDSMVLASLIDLLWRKNP